MMDMSLSDIFLLIVFQRNFLKKFNLGRPEILKINFVSKIKKY